MVLPEQESIKDFRERLEHARNEAMRRRQQELAEQTSHSNSAADRISLWERRHQLRLPRAPEHRLVDVIAKATALTRAEVEQEQQNRAIAGAVRQPAQEPPQKMPEPFSTG